MFHFTCRGEGHKGVRLITPEVVSGKQPVSRYCKTKQKKVTVGGLEYKYSQYSHFIFAGHLEYFQRLFIDMNSSVLRQVIVALTEAIGPGDTAQGRQSSR